MHLFLAILEDIADDLDIGHVFDLIDQKLDFLSFDVVKILRGLVTSFDGISGPHGTAPEDVDVQRVLDILLLNLLVHIMAIDDLLVDGKNVLLGAEFLIVLYKVVAVEFDVGCDVVALVLVVIVLFLDVLVVVFEEELPAFGLVDVDGEGLWVDLGEVGLDDLGEEGVGEDGRGEGFG